MLHARVRAVFRYWVWMLVLVKLVLPPTLALLPPDGEVVALKKVKLTDPAIVAAAEDPRIRAGRSRRPLSW